MNGAGMIDFDVISYMILGLSLSVTVVQLGHWLLNSNPRAVLNAGRWSAVGLLALTPVLLMWLVMSGRSTIALMLAAFALPLFVHSGLRWRSLFGPIVSSRSDFPLWNEELRAPIVPTRPVTPEIMTPDLARRSVAALMAYLEHAAGQSRSQPSRMHFADRVLNGGAKEAQLSRMSIEEALNVLGLDDGAGRNQINEAHHRLQQKLKPELGDEHYITRKIDEARDVLLSGE
jgi:hypothetical protein